MIIIYRTNNNEQMYQPSLRHGIGLVWFHSFFLPHFHGEACVSSLGLVHIAIYVCAHSPCSRDSWFLFVLRFFVMLEISILFRGSALCL